MTEALAALALPPRCRHVPGGRRSTANATSSHGSCELQHPKRFGATFILLHPTCRQLPVLLPCAAMSPLEVLPHPVDLSKYISLAEHQSSTPSSFYDGPPTLHFRAENCKIQITNDLLAAEGPLQAVFGPPPAHILNSPPKVPVQINFEGVHVVAASEYVPSSGLTVSLSPIVVLD